ncbi:hypothetical protein HY025_00395 [Candidatus Daviesbacteria bacterium]|nr:hypothetical protein [Candidatus Daviesbacteria bacterium]
MDNKQKKVDPERGEETEPNRKFVVEFEDAVSGKPLPAGAWGTESTERHEFRRRLLERAGKVRTVSGKPATYTDFFGEFPGFEKGIKDRLTKGLGDPKDILKAQPPTEKQAEELARMQERLVSEYSFCECCAPKLIKYISVLLRQRDNKANVKK